MKKIHLVTASLAALTGSALAADLPSRKEPIAAPVVVPMWTGFYAGLNAGYGWGTNSNTDASLWSTNSFGYIYNGGNKYNVSAPFVGGALGANRFGMTQSGFVGGAQFGYNYQWAQSFVVGFEADIQGTAMRGSQSGIGLFGGGATTAPFGDTGDSVLHLASGNQNGYGINIVSAGLDYLGTARGRVGYLFTPTLLVYGTAGLAYGGAWANVVTNGLSTTAVTTLGLKGSAGPFNVDQTYIGGGHGNSLLVGYTAGGGAEWMFMPNWSLKFEGLYYNLGNFNVSTVANSSQAFSQAVYSCGHTCATRQGYAGPGVIAGHTSVNYQGIIARAGVNYHFNWGAAPIVAKF